MDMDGQTHSGYQFFKLPHCLQKTFLTRMTASWILFRAWQLAGLMITRCGKSSAHTLTSIHNGRTMFIIIGRTENELIPKVV